MTMFDDPSAGDNPPPGASINYWLGAEAEDSVQVVVLNAAGDTVRTLAGTKEAGINRVMWDLQGEPSTEIVLRTKPLYADWFNMGDKRRRDSGQPRISVLAPPGTYTVALKVGSEVMTQSLEVLKDPNTEGTEADIQVQTAMMTELREDMNQAADAVNQIELLRRQLEDLRDVMADRDDAETVTASADSLRDALVAVEHNLLQLQVTGTGQDAIRWPSKIVERLGYLAGSVAIGDFAPTDPEREVHAILKADLAEQQQALEELLRTRVAEFNRLLRDRNVPTLISDGGM
jgi:hypothetical protein